jgi:hypothetical protein
MAQVGPKGAPTREPHELSAVIPGTIRSSGESALPADIGEDLKTSAAMP